MRRLVSGDGDYAWPRSGGAGVAQVRRGAGEIVDGSIWAYLAAGSVACLFTLSAVTSLAAARAPTDLRGYSPPPALYDPRACAVNCAWVMLRLLRQEVAREHVASVIPTGDRGTSLEQLRQGLCQLGVPVEVRRVRPDQLRHLDLPFIAHLELTDRGGAGHYVVVVDNQVKSFPKGKVVDSSSRPNYDAIRYIDGTSGVLCVADLEDFSRSYTGYVVVLASGPQRAIAWTLAAGIVLFGSLAIVKGMGKGMKREDPGQ